VALVTFLIEARTFRFAEKGERGVEARPELTHHDRG
jgi:hypothetical protein